MFLKSINRVLEMIHAESFQSQYLAWWMRQESNEAAGDTNISDDDLNFGLLVIRICLMSVQCLPHAGYPTSTTGVLKTHPSHLESWLYSMADELDKSLQSKKPTLVTVQHRYYHFVYLNNYARIRDSWSALNAAVKDAHEIGLHLEIPNVSLSEVEKEIRRRTFWSLYVGDRYMSSFFGHWPLIPEGYIYIDPPHDNLQPLSVNPYVLTSFTDRIFHIKITRFLTAFMSPPSWEHDRVDSIAIAEFTRQFQQVIIDPLPPVYRLESPRNTWDAIDPAITGKREMLSFIIWATKAFLYKAFADPSNSLQQQNSPTLKNGCDLIALSHRRSFMECSSKAILSIDNLYHRIGDEEGGAGEKLFFIPACLAEALANLGVCLLSIQADAKILGMDGIQFHNDPNIRRYYLSWFDGFSLLCQHSQQQPIARKGVTILEGLHETLRMFYQTAELLDAQSAQGLATESLMGHGYQAGQYQLEHALVSMHAHGGKRIQQSRSFPLPAWLPSYLATTGRSWLFQDPAAFADLMG
ncbi:hypothetical protein N7488_011043 [Penicillium malachiteum]|nr:hypothetical protein N7488_011043 [Penicillium malachiteum]